MEFMEYLNEDVYEKKKGYFLYIGGRVILITTGSNLLDSKYKFYGLNDTPLANEYYCTRLVFVGTNTVSVVMCKDSQ